MAGARRSEWGRWGAGFRSAGGGIELYGDIFGRRGAARESRTTKAYRFKIGNAHMTMGTLPTFESHFCILPSSTWSSGGGLRQGAAGARRSSRCRSLLSFCFRGFIWLLLYRWNSTSPRRQGGRCSGVLQAHQQKPEPFSKGCAAGPRCAFLAAPAACRLASGAAARCLLGPRPISVSWLAAASRLHPIAPITGSWCWVFLSLFRGRFLQAPGVAVWVRCHGSRAMASPRAAFQPRARFSFTFSGPATHPRVTAAEQLQAIAAALGGSAEGAAEMKTLVRGYVQPAVREGRVPVLILEVDTRGVSAHAQLGWVLGSIRESWASAQPRHIGVRVSTSVDAWA